MTPRPLWRWWLFCLACWAHRRTGSRHALALLGWCVLREWLEADPCCGLCFVCYGENFERVCHRLAGHDGECDGPTEVEHREVPF